MTEQDKARQLLKSKRKELGIAQYQLAESADISNATMCRIEKGQARTSRDVIAKLAVTLGLDGDALGGLLADSRTTIHTAEVVGQFGNLIYDWRSSRGIGRAELGKMCGVHKNSLFHLESGKHSPSIGSIVKIAKATGIPALDLAAAAISDHGDTP